MRKLVKGCLSFRCPVSLSEIRVTAHRRACVCAGQPFDNSGLRQLSLTVNGNETDRRSEIMSGTTKPAKEFDDSGVAAGHIGGQLFKQPDCSLSPSIINGFRDIQSLTARV